SKAKEITNSLFQCVTFKEKEINNKIRENITKAPDTNKEN
ncbi:MAG: phosphate acyltransferase, partial [Lachnobacterium sp.]|nr:phosphate acyltransferase [Lachnobacterium sp.]